MIHMTTGSGKMEGINSINTSTLSNEFCEKMSKSDSVCGKCYASRYEKMRGKLHAALVRNDKVLSSGFVPVDQLPFINAAFFRFDSFGELINDIHFKNLLNIVTKNPHCNFTLWTKRKNLIKQVLTKREKPANLTIIFSSPKLNKIAQLPQFFDKVFTVFDKKTAKSENVSINCGGKKCANCLICYTKNNVKVVNELLK